MGLRLWTSRWKNIVKIHAGPVVIIELERSGVPCRWSGRRIRLATGPLLVSEVIEGAGVEFRVDQGIECILSCRFRVPGWRRGSCVRKIGMRIMKETRGRAGD